MKRFLYYGFCILFSPCAFSITLSNAAHAFVTPRDLIQNSLSDISLQNTSNAPVTVYGIYVRQYAYVTPGNNCSSPSLIYNASENTSAGAVLTPIVIGAHQSAAIGANYLYNMIYQANYYRSILIPSSPPGCALPGCTWGSDSTIYHWCIYLGALAPSSSNSPDYANAYTPPSTSVVSSSGNYNYDLVTSYHYIGPISCNDQTLTCSAASAQTQSFS